MTVRRLGLLRHAKSSWDHPALADFERPLNKRGLRDAPRMGTLLAERGVKPAAIVSSSALRARTTAELVAGKLSIADTDLRLSKNLYHASAQTMLNVLDQLAGNDGEIILVGHNPGITELANRIADASIDNLPTAAFFYIEADIAQWSDLPDRPGRLLFFATPRDDLS